MKRREFLKAAATVPLVTAIPQAFHAAALAAEAKVLKMGEDLHGTPLHRGYSTMAYKVTSDQTGGRFFLFEHLNLVNGGPPLHLHPSLEEWFHVEEGRVLVQVGTKRVVLVAGDSVLVPRKSPHAFAGVGTPARMLIGFTPAGKMEDFFRDAATTPIQQQVAGFHAKYDIQLLGPPLRP
jgi:mannose-6-phosphate isomerase-like protein (cupin superfamily)